MRRHRRRLAQRQRGARRAGRAAGHAASTSIGALNDPGHGQELIAILGRLHAGRRSSQLVGQRSRGTPQPRRRCSTPRPGRGSGRGRRERGHRHRRRHRAAARRGLGRHGRPPEHSDDRRLGHPLPHPRHPRRRDDHRSGPVTRTRCTTRSRPAMAAVRHRRRRPPGGELTSPQWSMTVTPVVAAVTTLCASLALVRRDRRAAVVGLRGRGGHRGHRGRPGPACGAHADPAGRASRRCSRCCACSSRCSPTAACSACSRARRARASWARCCATSIEVVRTGVPPVRAHPGRAVPRRDRDRAGGRARRHARGLRGHAGRVRAGAAVRVRGARRRSPTRCCRGGRSCSARSRSRRCSPWTARTGTSMWRNRPIVQGTGGGVGVAGLAGVRRGGDRVVRRRHGHVHRHGRPAAGRRRAAAARAAWASTRSRRCAACSTRTATSSCSACAGSARTAATCAR